MKTEVPKETICTVYTDMIKWEYYKLNIKMCILYLGKNLVKIYSSFTFYSFVGTRNVDITINFYFNIEEIIMNYPVVYCSPREKQNIHER